MGVTYDSIDDLPEGLRDQVRRKLEKTAPVVAKRPKRVSEKSELVAHFDGLLRMMSLPTPTKEYAFAADATPPRKFRFDRAWLAEKVAVEIDGGTFGKPVRCHQCKVQVRAPRIDGSGYGGTVRTGGRHTQGIGYERDCEKGNLALLLGWRVLHVTAKMIRGDAVTVRHHLQLMLRGKG